MSLLLGSCQELPKYPTQIERYIHTPLEDQNGRCMRDRECNICHPIKIQQEMGHLNQVLQANEFLETLVKNTQ